MFWKHPKFLHILRIALPLLLTLLWLGFIFGNSLKDAQASSEQSGQVQEIVNNVASSVGVKEPISETTVRNMAHFTEFLVLGGLLCLDVWALGLSPLRSRRRFDVLWLFVSLPVSFLLASIDEVLQTFSKGRAAAPPALETSMGVSTSMKPWLSRYLLMVLMIFERFINVSYLVSVLVSP